MKTALVFILLLFVGSYSRTFAQQWTPLGSGVSGPNFEESVVERLVVIDGKLYACGYFNDAGGVPTWSVAYWTGTKWETHGGGVDSTVGVLDVVKYQDEIVAFFTWGGEDLINYWSGSAWEKFESEGLGAANYYTDAEVHNGQLYLLQDAEGIFHFNGTSWDKLPGSVLIETPRSLASYKNDLYIGAQNGLFKYNGSEIQQVWGLANIYGLKVLDNMLYMTGAYLGHIGADTMTGVAKFDGTQPISLGTPIAVDTTEFSEIIYDVTSAGNRLVASGDVHDATFGHSRILVYDGAWQSIGVADMAVRSLATIGNTVYVGGWFFNISGQPFSNVASIELTDDVSPAIRGHVFLDLNNNCQFDPNDKPLREHLVRAMPGPQYASTAADGSYVLFVEPGTYTITTSPLTYATHCAPEAYTVTDSASNVNFGFKSIDDTARVQPALAAGRYVAGRRNTIAILAMNLSGVPATNVGVTLQLGPYLTFLSSDHSYQQTGPQEYLFTIPSIPPQGYERIIVLDSVDVGSIGQYANVRVFSFVGIGLEDTDMELILGPHDPNEKLVASQLEGPYVMQDTIEADDVLTYKVNFQNVGTDTAYQVIIRDTISPLLDLSTFQTTASTHEYKVDVQGSNIITWTFDNINLPDSGADYANSNGGVRYRIDQKSGNTPGTVITNSAAIYFDFNAPVITNETTNIIALPSSVARSASGQALRITPNPAGNMVSIGLAIPTSAVARLSIYSILGNEVYSITAGLPALLSVEMLPRGMYRVLVSLRSGETVSGNLILH